MKETDYSEIQEIRIALDYLTRKLTVVKRKCPANRAIGEALKSLDRAEIHLSDVQGPQAKRVLPAKTIPTVAVKSA